MAPWMPYDFFQRILIFLRPRRLLEPKTIDSRLRIVQWNLYHMGLQIRRGRRRKIDVKEQTQGKCPGRTNL